MTYQFFIAKDPQSFDDWLEQINKVGAVTNEDCISWHFQNTKDLSVKQLAHFCPLWMEQNQRTTLQFWLSGYLCKHAVTMLIDQQQKAI